MKNQYRIRRELRSLNVRTSELQRLYRVMRLKGIGEAEFRILQIFSPMGI